MVSIARKKRKTKRMRRRVITKATARRPTMKKTVSWTKTTTIRCAMTKSSRMKMRPATVKPTRKER